MYYVYALVSGAKDRIYVGLTQSLESRIKQHNLGRTKSTKPYKPWTLLYSEEFNSRITARTREKRLKSGAGKDFLKKILRRCACSSIG